MKYIASWIEKKTVNVGGVPKQLLEGTFKGEDGVEVKATIWRDQKDGSVFPNFDTLMSGATIEANPWANAQGKVSLYPPKAIASTGGASRGNSGAINKAMDKKNESIKGFQETKEVSIKLAGAMRDAVLITTARGISSSICTIDEVKSEILMWRNWLLENHGDLRDVVDPTR